VIFILFAFVWIKIGKIAHRAHRGLRQRLLGGTPKDRRVTVGGPGAEAVAAAEKGSVAVQSGQTTLMVGSKMLAKLQAIYLRHSSGGKAATLSYSAQRTAFNERLFCTLLRYEPTPKTSLAALPPAVLEVLWQRFGACVECFASPLDAHFSRFCSAYPDTDACFGSLGPFLCFYPPEGSFIAHPPPGSPQLLQSTALHVNKLLYNAQSDLPASQHVPKAPRRRRPPPQEGAEAAAAEVATSETAAEAMAAVEDAAAATSEVPKTSGAMARFNVEESPNGSRALSFVVVVQHAPEWIGWQTFANSPFLAYTETLTRSTHRFVNGARYLSDSVKLVRPPGDSTLFVLQTAAAASKWPCTDDAIAQVRAAFEAPPLESPHPDPVVNKGPLSGPLSRGDHPGAGRGRGDWGHGKNNRKSNKRARDSGYKPQSKPKNHTRAKDDRPAKKRH